METVLHDMLQDLEVLKQQKQDLAKIKEYLETQHQLSLRMEQKVLSFESLPVKLTNDQLSSLMGFIKQEFEWLQGRIEKATYDS